MARPLVQVLLDDVSLLPYVRGACDRIDAEIDVAEVAAAPSNAARSRPDARILLTASTRAAETHLPKLKHWFDQAPCATLVLSPNERVDTQSIEDPATGEAISFSGRMSQEDLANRLRTMCELRRPIEALQAEVQRLRHRDEVLTAKMRRLDEELRVAAELQRDLLPRELPEVRGGAIHRLFRPVGAVSGDIYDVVRLDEEHIAISLADATGHDLAAALLTAFIKRSLCGRDAYSESPAASDPGSVLAKLNTQICHMGLSECQFVAAIHAVYNEKTRCVRWVRGGAPYPILVRAGRAPEQIRSAGPVLGADPDAEFETVELTLEPGDTLLWHTDGLDALYADHKSKPGGMDLSRSTWYAALADRRPAVSLTEIERRLATLDDLHANLDDITAVAIELLDGRISPRSWADVSSDEAAISSAGA